MQNEKYDCILQDFNKKCKKYKNLTSKETKEMIAGDRKYLTDTRKKVMDVLVNLSTSNIGIQQYVPCLSLYSNLSNEKRVKFIKDNFDKNSKKAKSSEKFCTKYYNKTENLKNLQLSVLY